jgi:hypothetical protein
VFLVALTELEVLNFFSRLLPIPIPAIAEQSNLRPPDTPQVKSVAKVRLCSSCLSSENSKVSSKSWSLPLIRNVENFLQSLENLNGLVAFVKIPFDL